jgi:hypothetical protein
MTSSIKTDLNYFVVTIACAFTALVPAVISAIQLTHSRAGGLRDVYEVLVCLAFVILIVGLSNRQRQTTALFIFEASSSFILAIIFTIFLIKILGHPSTTGDGDDIGVFLVPAIGLFLTQSFMALVRFQTEVIPQ